MRHTLKTLAGFALVALVFSIERPAQAQADHSFTLLGQDTRHSGPTEESEPPTFTECHQDVSNTSPMIISLGPPPITYLPSADFGSRVQAAPAWAAASDVAMRTAPRPTPMYMPPPPMPYMQGYYPQPGMASAFELPPPPPPGYGKYIGPPAVVEQFVRRDGQGNFVATEPVPTWYAPPAFCTPVCATAGEWNCVGKAVCTPISTSTCACGTACTCGANCACNSACACPKPYSPPIFSTACTAAVPACSCNGSACSAGGVACSQTSDSACNECGTAEKVAHMLEAVHHLDMAGMKADADALRQKCDCEMVTVLARLKKVEAELARLKSTASPHKMQIEYKTAPAAATFPPEKLDRKTVAVKVELIEIDRSKAHNLGFDFQGSVLEAVKGAGVDASLFLGPIPRNANLHDTVRFGAIDRSSALMGFLEALKQDDLARVLSRPQLLTLDGQKAMFQCGQGVPYPSLTGNGLQYKNVGTRFSITPTVIGLDPFNKDRYPTASSRIKLDFKFDYSEIDPSRTFSIAGQEVPAICKQGIDTGAVLNDGQTLVICGMCRTKKEAVVAPRNDEFSEKVVREQDVEYEYIVLVHPEISGGKEPNNESITSTLATPSCAPCTSCLDLNSNWAETCTPFMKPVSCDEGPVFSTACCEIAVPCNCALLPNFSGGKNAFPKPTAYDPLEPKQIELPAVKFELPAVLPAAKQCEGEFHTGTAPAAFIPRLAKPLRMARPVVTPVVYEEPVSR